MNLKRGLLLLVAVFLVVTALLFIFAPPSPAHVLSIADSKARIVNTHVNGLCGKGWAWFCPKSKIDSLYLYRSADGHWRVFKVAYNEGKMFDPWAAHTCIVNRVSVSGNGVVGTPTKPSYCYK